jgi:hypothetical protein
VGALAGGLGGAAIGAATTPPPPYQGGPWGGPGPAQYGQAPYPQAGWAQAP